MPYSSVRVRFEDWCEGSKLELRKLWLSSELREVLVKG